MSSRYLRLAAAIAFLFAASAASACPGAKMKSADGSRAIERNRLFADAYFSRGACHYALLHYQQAREDLNVASLFGCRVAQLWSRFEIKMPDEPDEVDAPDL